MESWRLSSGCGVCVTPSNDSLSSEDGFVSVFESVVCSGVGSCCVVIVPPPVSKL